VRFFLGNVLPYLAWAVFLLGLAWRTVTWLTRPVPMSLTLLPGPADSSRRAALMALELLGFRSLWRGDRVLALTAWLMHLSLAVVLAGHVVGIATLGGQFCWFGADAATSAALSHWLGMTSGLLLAGLLALLGLRRLSIAELRRLSAPSDYLALGLLLAAAGSGIALRAACGTDELGNPSCTDLVQVRAYLASLLVLRPGEMPGQPFFVLHFTLVNLLLMYFPFSKLVHLTGGVVSRVLTLRPCPVYPTPAGRST
jgi:nitrate reductase gamma subunit